MITWDDIAELLALAAVYDQRKGDDLDIKAWLAVAQVERWTPAAARRVVIEHYARRADRPRIDPATISDRIRHLRGAAAESFEAPRIPEGLPNHQYPAWLRQQLAAHVDQRLELWATNGEEPSRALPAAPAPAHSLAELIAKAPQQHRAEMKSSLARINTRRVRSADDSHRLEQARRELDSRRTEDTA